MKESLRVFMVTEEAVIYEGDAVSVRAPGQAGSFGIWPNHAPFISTLNPGKIILTPGFGAPPFVFNSRGSGFLEVLKNTVTIILP